MLWLFVYFFWVPIDFLYIPEKSCQYFNDIIYEIVCIKNLHVMTFCVFFLSPQQLSLPEKSCQFLTFQIFFLIIFFSVVTFRKILQMLQLLGCLRLHLSRDKNFQFNFRNGWHWPHHILTETQLQVLQYDHIFWIISEKCCPSHSCVETGSSWRA